MIKLSDYVFNFVSDLGVKHVFLLPGGGCMHLVDSLGRATGLEYVCNLHEQAASIAAEAYGQFTNNFGVALVTTGPGGTNAITGVTGAWIDSTPCLIISGQVKRADLCTTRGVRQMGAQEVDIVSIVKPITKYAVTVNDPLKIRYHLEKAVALAKSGRPGPVWIDIPLDVQASMIEETMLEGYSSASGHDAEQDTMVKLYVSRAIELLNEASRPVVLVGNGVRLAGAERIFIELVEKLNIPVLTTWKTIDFFTEDHPLYFGRPGSIGQRAANFIQQNADFILTIGARLDLGQVGYNYKNFARAAKKVIVDVDMHEIRKIETHIDVAACADAKTFIQEFLGQLDRVDIVDRFDWLQRCSAWKEKYPVILPEYWDNKDYVNTYVLVDVLSDEMVMDDVLIPGSSGSCSEITMQAFRVKKGQRVLNTPGLGSMGFGLPAAIGACLASGCKTTVCLNGDGGFQLNIQELETLHRLKLPIKIFYLNNQGYGSIRATQRNYFNGRYVCSDVSSGLTLPDIIKVAGAYGITTRRITSHENIREIVNETLSIKGPVVCEVMIEQDLPTAPRITSVQKPDGSMVSKPLEDLWPFLDRKEFMENMIIPPLEE